MKLLKQRIETNKAGTAFNVETYRDAANKATVEVYTISKETTPS